MILCDGNGLEKKSQDINGGDVDMKDNEELFEIVLNNDMMCHDGLFSKDGGEDFPLKYVEFPNSVVKKDND